MKHVRLVLDPKWRRLERLPYLLVSPVRQIKAVAVAYNTELNLSTFIIPLSKFQTSIVVETYCATLQLTLYLAGELIFSAC